MKYFLPIIIFGSIFTILFGIFSYKKSEKAHTSDRIEEDIEVSIPDEPSENPMVEEKVVITTLFDNYKTVPSLLTAHGFSCLVEVENESGKYNILFDTGADGNILLSNMDILKIDAANFDSIFLSHIHSDHVGGLNNILEKNNKLQVFIPKSFPDSIKQTIESYNSNYKEIKNQEEIYNLVYSTGEIGTSIIEQSLVLETEKGLVVITGCAHPGIVNIVRKMKKILPGKKVYLVMGGFHLSTESNTTIENIIKDFRELGVEKVAPSHCSGNRTRELFKEEYKENYINNGVGNIIEI